MTFNCKFKINDKVSISDKTLTFINPPININPPIIEYVNFKAGFIRRLLPSNSYECLYEIQFNDGRIATEVLESYIRKSITIVRDSDSPLGNGTTTDSDTQTDNIYSPFSLKQQDYKMDMMTLIALNNFNESLHLCTFKTPTFKYANYK